MTCPYCNGRPVLVAGYEFGERYEVPCPVCAGSHDVEPSDLARRLVAAERARDEAAGELSNLRTHVALYLHYAPIQDELKAAHAAGDYAALDARNPGLATAPRPSPWASTWFEYLKEAAGQVPRKMAACA